MAPALVSQVPQPNYSDMVVGPMGPIKARAPAHHTAARRPRAERLARVAGEVQAQGEVDVPAARAVAGEMGAVTFELNGKDEL